MNIVQMQNTKLANIYTSIDEKGRDVAINGKPYDLKTGESKKKEVGNEYYITTMMSYGYQTDDITDDTPEYIKLYGKKLTWFDRCVMDAVYALFKAGQGLCADHVRKVEISFSEIYRYMMNTSGHVKKSPISKIKKSLCKMAMIWVEINITNDLPDVMRYFERQNNERYTKYCLKEHMIICSFIEKKMKNGTEASGILVHDTPVLWKYAEATGQFCTAPASLYNIPNMYMTEENIALRGYLITYLFARKKGKLHNPVLKYSTIFEKAGISAEGTDSTASMRRNRLRKSVKDILNYYSKTETGEIVKEWTEKEKNVSLEIVLG